MKAINLIYGALCISICLLSFFAFRGLTNVINALIVPLTLGIFTQSMNFREKVAVFIALGIFVFILFPLQVIFLLFYVLLSLVLVFLYKKNMGALKSYFVFSLLMSVFFTGALYLTDFVFKTRIASVTTDILGGNVFFFFVSVAVQAFVISAIVLSLYYFINKRVLFKRGSDQGVGSTGRDEN